MAKPKRATPSRTFSAFWTALREAANPAQTKALEKAAERAGTGFDIERLQATATKAQLATLRDVIVSARARSQNNAAQVKAADAGDRHRQRMADRSRKQSSAAREIGPVPPVVNPERRERCRRDLKAFYLEYFPDVFFRPFSPDQEAEIKGIQTTVLQGSLQAFAEPRGDGKSVRAERALVWATLYGYHAFSMLVHATDEKGNDALADLVTTLETNERLNEDFPEVCFAIRALGGIHNRAKGQTVNGLRTAIRFTRRKLILPTIPGSPSSGAIIASCGLMSATRGAKHLQKGGKVLRPSLVLIDDPQTRESAASPDQTNTREKILTADLLGCAPQGKRMSALCACTVIEAGDLADRLLDKNRHPEWKSRRGKMLPTFPSKAALELWEQYFEIVREDLRNDDCEEPYKRATRFYKANREAMDDGAVVGNPHRFDADELGPVQHAMNLFFQMGPEGFATEYNNDPLPPGEGDGLQLEAAKLSRKISGFKRLILPQGTQHVTGFIDVHQKVLYWMLCAWEPDFTGTVIDYGTFPKSPRAHFTEKNFRPTLQENYPSRGPDGAIYAGLQALSEQLADADYEREDGVKLRLTRCLIDCGFNSAVVRRAIRESKHRTVLMPSFGRTCDANQVPISAYRAKPGEHISPDEWLIRGRSRSGMHLIFDTYHWKSFTARRLLTDRGDPGSLSFYGVDAKDRHDFLSEHLTSELPEPVTGNRRVDVWRKIPARQNHYFDCIVGAAVAASVCGVRLAAPGGSVNAPKKRQRERVSYL